MYIIRCICLWMILGLMACSGPVRIQKNLEVKPEIFPDYVDVTIPPNIAPLNFKLKDACTEARAILECGPEKLEIKTGKDACFVIPASGWKRLLNAIIENKMSGNNCMNCHSFCMQNPEKMLFHMRETYSCTLLIDGDKVEKLNTKTDQTLSPLVYPSWHPSGKYVALSMIRKSMRS